MTATFIESLLSGRHRTEYFKFYFVNLYDLIDVVPVSSVMSSIYQMFVNTY